MTKIDTGLHYPIDLDSLPTGWCADYVGALAADVQSGFACGSHSAENIGVAHLRPMNVSREGKIDLSDVKFVAADYDERRLEEGDVLFNNTNSPELIGKTAFVDSKASKLAFSNHMTRVRFLEAVEPKFAAFQLHYLWMARYFLHRCVKHVNQASVSSRDLSKSVPFIVAPVEEQRRIVAKLDELMSELDHGIASVKAARERLKIYRQSVLTNAFCGKLTAEWRERRNEKRKSAKDLLEYIRREREASHEQRCRVWEESIEQWEAAGKPGKKPTKPRAPKHVSDLSAEEAQELPELPKGWFWAKLGWITCGVEYGTSAKSSKVGDVPVLRMGNIQNMRFDWADLVFTSDDEEIQKYSLYTGDVLFNRTNSPELVGKTAIYRGERPALFAGYLIRVNHIKTIVDSRYLNFFLNSHLAKRHGNKVKTDGVNQSNINGDKLQSYPFPYCDIAEQREIVHLLEEEMSHIDEAEKSIEDELARSAVLRQSILKRAFSGQLVPQEVDDEPALVLLARIRGECSQREKESKGKKKDAA